MFLTQSDGPELLIINSYIKILEYNMKNNVHSAPKRYQRWETRVYMFRTFQMRCLILEMINEKHY